MKRPGQIISRLSGRPAAALARYAVPALLFAVFALSQSFIYNKDRIGVMCRAADGREIPAVSVIAFQLVGHRTIYEDYIKRVSVALPKDSLRHLEEIVVSIGPREFRFGPGEIAQFERVRHNQRPLDGHERETLFIPGSARAPGSFLAGFAVRDAINWRGDAFFLGNALALFCLCWLCLLLAGRVLGRAEKDVPADGIDFDRHKGLIGAACGVLALAAFDLLFFNKFLPLSEGWFSLYARYLSQGLAPYRDFYLFVPPMHTLLVKWISAVFGDSFLVMRTAGLAVALAQAAVLFRIFARFFPTWAAFWASFFSILVYQSHCAFIFHDYNDFVNLYAMLLLLTLLRYPEQRGDPRATALNAAAAGFLCSLTLLTKHNVGLLLLASCAGFLTVFEARRRQAGTGRALLFFLAGLAAPALPAALWLEHKGVLGTMFRQLFLEGGGKGSLQDILLRWLPWFFDTGRLAGIALFAAAAAALNYRLFSFGRPGPEEGGLRKLLLAFAAALACVFIPYYYRTLSYVLKSSLVLLEAFKLSSLLAAVFSAAVLAVFLRRIFKGGDSDLNYQTGLTALFSVMFVFAATMSAGTYIPAYGTLLASGFFAGSLLTASSRGGWGPRISFVCVLLLTMFMVSARYIKPYGGSPDARWWGTGRQDDARDALYAPRVKALGGIYAGEQMGAAVETIARMVETGTAPGDSIFAYPHMPMFYLFGGRKCPAYSIVHWYDVVNPGLCEEDALRVKAARPAMLIWMKYAGQEDLLAHEDVYNEGEKLSGQRKIIATLTEMTAQPGPYRLVGVFPVESNCRVEVYQLQPPAKAPRRTKI